MSAVSDTGPLVALARIDQLDLMPRLFGRLSVPPSVAQELRASSGPHHPRLQRALSEWLDVQPLTRAVPPALAAERRLSLTDREVIALALELGHLLIMDERAGRAAAQRLGLLVTGVAEFVRRAKVAGLVPAERPLLAAMVREGYWLAPALIDRVAERAGE